MASNNMENAPEPDTDSGFSGDSALGSEASGSVRTASLASSIVNYEYENGRRYHAFRKGSYFMPNDEAEQDRLDLHHHIFRLGLDGDLLAGPVPKDVKRVLDVGTGTGIWAIDYADEHPDATVTGTDLSPIQPSWLPPNCSFYVEDVESEWLYSPEEAFDLIHSRGMVGSVGSWSEYYAKILQNLKPGGWCEVQEYEGWIHAADDPRMVRSPHTARWQVLCDEASTKFGKRLNVAEEQKQNMIDAGFVEVGEKIISIPIGMWAKGRKQKEAGMYQEEHMCACLESFTLALLTRVLDWSFEECQVLMAGIRNEFRDPKTHLYTVFHFVYGRKPLEPG